ncbi:MAG: aldehyde:ferredoxin oxidoreductase [Candidatus Lokiarchaeota archaeon]|nr:aldehyde:ferredoxin oxidoreductase [Candidatus Lokiarchaeota archaeon]
MKGYAGKALKIDLDKETFTIQELDSKFCEDYIGGYGFGAKILWDELPKGCDPLSPENVLIFALGPAQASLLPTASKYGVFAKSPLTNVFGMAISSGSVGSQMRRAGYDALIIKGKSKKPIYLFVDDEEVHFMDASHLWGENTKDAFETEEIIRKEWDDSRIAVASIGVAGEKLVKIACITNDRGRQAGRTGMGCVMGSKNLKAIAFRGSHDVPVAGDFPKVMAKYLDLIKRANGKATIKYRDLGTPINTLVFNKLGCLPTRNFQSGFFKGAEALSGEAMRDKWVVKKVACAKCPIACDHLCLVKEGPYKGAISSVDFESIFALGSCCSTDNMEAVIAAIDECDKLGIDTMSGGVTISFGMEAFEKGLLTKADTGDLDFSFGNGDAVVQMVKDISNRSTKAGDILAEGSRGAALKLGKDSIKYAMQIKGLEIPGYVLRALKTAALGFGVSIRGGCHLRNGAYSPDVGGKVDRSIEEPDRGKHVIPTENMYGVIDSLIVCKFTRGVYANDAEIAEVFQMITDIPMDDKKLNLTGERIVVLSKCFNLREGATKQDDMLPARCYEEKLKDGVTDGWVIDKKKYVEMLDGYYKLRGWDNNGVPSKAKLQELGLEFCEKEMAILRK